MNTVWTASKHWQQIIDNEMNAALEDCAPAKLQTRNAHVLVDIAEHPGSTMRDMAGRLGIAESLVYSACVSLLWSRWIRTDADIMQSAHWQVTKAGGALAQQAFGALLKASIEIAKQMAAISGKSYYANTIVTHTGGAAE